MQFDPLRAFPYPVLRPGSNDYLDSAMQTVVELIQSPDNLDITAVADIAVGVDEIRALMPRARPVTRPYSLAATPISARRC